MKTYVIMVATKFPANHVNKGTETDFVDKIKRGEKIHTLRQNAELWKKRFREIEKGNACISLRYWSGKPYASKQVEIKKLYKEDGIGCVEINFHKIIKDITLRKFALSDGLTEPELIDWFGGVKIDKPLALIHFDNRRYKAL